MSTEVKQSESYKKQYAKLDGIMRERVARTIQKLIANPHLPGLNLERLQSANSKVFSVRVSRKYRLIFKYSRSGDVYLLSIANHDSAYKKTVLHYFMLPSGVKPHEDDGETMKMFQSHINLDVICAELSQIIRESNLSDGEISLYVTELIRRILQGGTEGKAPSIPGGDQATSQQGRGINVIPSKAKGSCCELLLAFCFDSDSFNDRLREIAYHAGIHCPDTKLVILVTSQWINKDWKKNHEKAFADLNAKIVIYFAGLGTLTRIA